MKKQKLKVFSVRADMDMMTLAKFYKLDLGETFRRAVERAVADRNGVCSTCGQKVRAKAKKA